jgi:hypothetical protein
VKLALTALLLLTVAACSSAAEDAPPATVPPPAPPLDTSREPLDVQWSRCTLETEAAQAAQCATVRMPYRWDVTDGRSVSVFVKRYRPRGLVTRGQLWLLQGGPGASAKDMDSLDQAVLRAM